MAVYKVIQDIEAEDKLLGPLTLKGFIYAAIAGVLAFLSVRLAMAGSLGDFRWAFLLIMIPPMVFFGVLAAPIGKDQPTEVWLLSHLRFFLQTRRKVWDQSGPNYSVVITAPKKIEKQLTKNLSQTEVKSRLKALATTLDSRGWAIKNIDVNLSAPSTFAAVDQSPDRLITPSSLPVNAPVIDVHPEDDILDTGSNAKAKHFKDMMQKADEERRKELLENLEQTRRKTVEKKTDTAKIEQPTKPKPAEVTTGAKADKLELAKSGNAFSVASLSQLANRHEAKVTQLGPNEVEIDLH